MIFLRRNEEAWHFLATTALMSFLFLALPVSLFIPTACATPREDLDQAIEFFDFADYGAALDIVDRILVDGQAVGSVLRDTHIYRARALIGMDRVVEAQDAFCEALVLDNEWRPDGVFYSSDEITVFDQSFATCDLSVEDPGDGIAWYKKPVAMIVGGVVVVGGLVLALAGGGGDDEPTPSDSLPGFPDPPPTQGKDDR